MAEMTQAAAIIESVGSVLWPIVLAMFLVIAKKPIAELINNISEVVLKAQTIKVSGGLTLSRDTIEGALVDRERLVIGILVGASEYPEKSELRDLTVQAMALQTYLESLSSQDKQRLMSYAIELAASDRKFSRNELTILVRIGQRYGLKPSNVKSRLKYYAEDLHVDTREITEELLTT